MLMLEYLDVEDVVVSSAGCRQLLHRGVEYGASSGCGLHERVTPDLLVVIRCLMRDP